MDFTHLPDDDKIKTVAHAIQDMQSTIKNDVDKIKRFVSNVSHEFKTPLMMMQSSSELALASKAYQQWLESNIQQIKRMDTLLGALIQMTQQQKQQNISKEIVQLKLLVEGIVDEISSQYDKQQIINIIIEDQAEVLTHSPSLWIILSNLIDNAYKYSSPWSNIHISYKQSDGYPLTLGEGLGVRAPSTKGWTLTVSNTWSHIAQEKLDCIREPFRQADTSKEKDQGFGLGLSLVKELVEKQWWAITAESDHQGTSFTIIIPH